MPLVLQWPLEAEEQFEAWAAQQGEAVQQDTHAVYSAVAERRPWETLATLFVKALTPTSRITGRKPTCYSDG